MKKVLVFLLICALLSGMVLPALAVEDDPLLTLVNPWHTIPKNWKVDLVSLGNGHRVDKTCYDDLIAMMASCRAAGLRPVVRSSYRNQATQKQLYENKVRQWKGYGYSDAEARKKAATIVAPPGTSEHQLGWAVDIVDASYRDLNEQQANTPTQKWLMEHSWEYGFILRYPVDKSEITGIIYEPWHYRYVGKEYAKQTHESGLCLEEWLEAQENIQMVKNAIHVQAEELRRKIAILLWHNRTTGLEYHKDVSFLATDSFPFTINPPLQR